MKLPKKGRVTLAFAIVLFASFIPELNPEFFGDWICNGATMKETILHNGNYLIQYQGCNYGTGFHGAHSPMFHYGFRHWMWIACGLTLFVWNIVELFNDESK